jgi:anti-anti-sigma regulatory factor
MATFNGRHVLVERARESVWVVRFVRADLRDQLYDDADADACPLFQELFERALAHLQEGQTVILNLGLVEQFPAAFYRCLLKVREVVAARHARLRLCRLSPEHEEIFRLFKGFDLFRVITTEGRALHEATARKDSGEEGALQKGSETGELYVIG